MLFTRMFLPMGTQQTCGWRLLWRVPAFRENSFNSIVLCLAVLRRARDFEAIPSWLGVHVVAARIDEGNPTAAGNIAMAICARKTNVGQLVRFAHLRTHFKYFNYFSSL